MPKIIPTIALYEFIGPKTDNSPCLSANTIKQFPIAPVIPPAIAYSQNSGVIREKFTNRRSGIDIKLINI